MGTGTRNGLSWHLPPWGAHSSDLAKTATRMTELDIPWGTLMFPPDLISSLQRAENNHSDLWGPSPALADTVRGQPASLDVPIQTRSNSTQAAGRHPGRSSKL